MAAGSAARPRSREAREGSVMRASGGTARIHGSERRRRQLPKPCTGG